MKVKSRVTLLLIAAMTLAMMACSTKQSEHIASYTSADSLTEVLLNLQDSLLITWNQMMSDDNAKIRAMQALVHELEESGQLVNDEAKSLQHRIEQLKESRFTAKNISHDELVEEYDFTANSLAGELISLAESNKGYAYNTGMQKLVEQIRLAEQRVENYRVQYDAIASSFNELISANASVLNAVDNSLRLEKKPLFHARMD